MCSSLEENVLLNTEDREQVRVRGVRGAQLASRDTRHSARARKEAKYKCTAAKLSGTIYSYHTPSKRRDTEFCSQKKKKNRHQWHTGQAHWPKRKGYSGTLAEKKKGYSGSLATGDTGPIHKCEHTGSGHIGPGHIGPTVIGTLATALWPKRKYQSTQGTPP